MKVMYAKNPASLQVIENPAKGKRYSAKNGSSTATTRAKNKTVTYKSRNNPMNTSEMKGTFKKVAAPALAVVAGLAGSNLATQQVLNIASTANPTMRKVVSIGTPFVIAAILIGQKNSHVKMAGVGAGVVSIQNAFKIFAPGVKMMANETIDGLRTITRPQASGYLSNAAISPEGRLLLAREQDSGKAIAHNSGFLSSSALPTRATYIA